MSIILILLSFIPIYIILGFIYANDKVEKEPWQLLLATFIGGVISLFITKILAAKFHSMIPFLIEGNPNNEKYKIFLISFGEIGLIEELSKWIILYLVIWRRKNFNYIYDGIIYAVFVSLGFAAVENIYYLWGSNFGVLLGRIIFTIPAHASFGIIMGYYFGYARYYKKMKYNSTFIRYMYSSVFFVILYHGLFDYVLATDYKYNVVMFIATTIFIFTNAIMKLRKVNKIEVTW